MNSVAKRNEPTLTIRPLAGRDLAEVVKLERAIFSDPWPESAFKEQISDEGWGAIVAECDGNVIGYACYLAVGPEGHLTNLAVNPAHRRKSVAKQLLEHILRDVKKASCECIILEVRPSNTEARAFYQRHGFSYLYRRPDYYRRPVEDALVFVNYLDEEDGW
ncbi:MAG: ribosomal protein S18-alanine N-acetyltransferase [candidate division Zixibacteria bacterium]|nr:ribosomal protein S18-alanine N-acetyltransferase [candidate division Zixibacteria bacterium]